MDRRYILLVFCLYLLHIRADGSAEYEYKYPTGSIPCKLYDTSYLDCSLRDLTDVPPLPANVTQVDLAYNKINSISQTAFSRQDQMIQLEIPSNCIESINGSPFKDLVELRFLNLIFSCLETLAPSSFQGLYNLLQLYLRFNLLTSLPTDIFSGLIHLQFLDLSFNLLTHIPSSSLAPLQMLTAVDMFGNFFTSFEFGTGFNNLTNLSALYVHSFDFASERSLGQDDWCSILPNPDFCVYLDNKTFENLAQLSLKRLDILFDIPNPNTTVYVDDGIFSPLKNLTDLVTSEGFEYAISFVPSELTFLKQFILPDGRRMTDTSLQFAYNFNISLIHLDLSYSHINGIYGPAFIEFSNLRVLNLSGVIYSLQYISNDSFLGLHKLEQLYLAHNQINKLPVQAFKAFANGSLKMLDLSYNALTGAFDDDDNAFSAVSSITHLNLSGNPMVSIGRWIHVLQNLEELRLDSIITTRFIWFNYWTLPLPSLTRFYFGWPNVPDILKYQNEFYLHEKAPNLKTLSIAETSIFSLLTIRGLSQLEYLDASGAVTEIGNFDDSWGAFIFLPNLKVLYLASNRLKSIDNMQLNVTTPNIVSLDFSDNFIKTVAEASLEYLPKLRQLDLRMNQIYSLEGLLSLPFIEIFSISNNFISEVPRAFVDKLNRSLKALDMSGNPFSCTCSIEPFRKWILYDTSVFLVPNRLYQCKTPKNLEGFGVTQIDLDCSLHLLKYISIGVSSGLSIFFIAILVGRYRWHIKYRLFLFFTWKRKYRPLENDEGHEPFRLCIGHARDFIPGTPLLEAITGAIHTSRKTIVVLSPSYLESEWCYFETQHAWLRLLNEGQDVLILVLLKPIPDDKMTMWLRQFLCKKGYLRWPHNKAGQDVFFRYLREIIKKPTSVDRRYDV